MDTDDQRDLGARLARLEARLDAIHERVNAPPKVEGGIGCFGFLLFLVLFVKLDQLVDLVRALGS